MTFTLLYSTPARSTLLEFDHAHWDAVTDRVRLELFGKLSTMEWDKRYFLMMAERDKQGAN